MKIARLSAENFKILKAVEIVPEGNVVTIGGKNGQGKSSVLDAIWVALEGKAVAPARPVRSGEQKCTIELDLGSLYVTRIFRVSDSGEVTTSVKVENSEGLRYGSPQQVLDGLLGAIGFDPFEFVGMKPEKQAETLLELVPLPIDLDEFAALDASDYAKRRDVNRDLKVAESQLAGIEPEEIGEIPDRQALLDQLSLAAETNSAIERDKVARADKARQAGNCDQLAANAHARAGELRAEMARAEAAAAEQAEEAKRIRAEIEAMPPLADYVDTEALAVQIKTAEALEWKAQRQRTRTTIAGDVDRLKAESEAFTAAMEQRETQRREALAKAKMPIDGLGIEIAPDGKATVTFGGQPFNQISSAEQIKASTAIAMAANPTLRVLRIKDGSLLDDDSMAQIAAMAEAEDYQIWIEKVGTGSVGIVIEAGEVKGATDE